MNILLRYRRGTVLREELRYSEGDAIVRAGELIENDTDCSGFEITNERGERLKGDREIRRAYSSLWDNELVLLPSPH